MAPTEALTSPAISIPVTNHVEPDDTAIASADQQITDPYQPPVPVDPSANLPDVLPTPAQGPTLADTALSTGQLDGMRTIWDNAATGYQYVWADGTSSLSNVIMPTNHTAGWYSARISYGANGVYTTDIDNNISVGPKRIEPRVKKKLLLLDRPFMAVMKKPQIAMLGEDNGDQPIAVDVEEIKHSRVIRQGTKKRYEFEVYEVPNDEGYIDTLYRKECLDGRGLRETGGGFFVFDPEVRSKYRFSKMVELKQAPSYISQRQRLQHKLLSPNEIIARDLLRRYVGDKEFKRYLKFGYIVMTAHGFHWRVPGENATIARVEQYDRNKLVNKYCVHFADPSIPPSDACIMRMALISAGVDTLKTQSNVTPYGVDFLGDMIKSVDSPITPKRRFPLTSQEAFQQMKKELCLN